MKRTATPLAFILAFVCAIQFTAAAGNPKNDAQKAELKARFEQRFPEIKRFKSDGKVGETSAGYLEAVKSSYLDDKAMSKLIDDENADRKALYKLIAEDEGIDADHVASRAAQRNFQHAQKGEYLKEDGRWRQK